METTLGMSQAQADSTSWRGTDQGTQLKSAGTSCFQALLAGGRGTDGSFAARGGFAIFWSSTEGGLAARSRGLDSFGERVFRSALPKANGYNVRCVKD